MFGENFNVKKIIENIIFSSRWFLIPFYLGLMLALVCYSYVFAKESFHMINDLSKFSVNQALLIFLELLDITMIANLIKMIITGSYNSFVSKTHGYRSENISSGTLKVKMATSLIGVSSIQLLQTFINTGDLTLDEIMKKVLIHVAFLVGALILAIIDYLHSKSDKIESETELIKEKVEEHDRKNKLEEKYEKEKLKQLSEEVQNEEKKLTPKPIHQILIEKETV